MHLHPNRSSSTTSRRRMAGAIATVLVASSVVLVGQVSIAGAGPGITVSGIPASGTVELGTLGGFSSSTATARLFVTNESPVPVSIGEAGGYTTSTANLLWTANDQCSISDLPPGATCEIDVQLTNDDLGGTLPQQISESLTYEATDSATGQPVGGQVTVPFTANHIAGTLAATADLTTAALAPGSSTLNVRHLSIWNSQNQPVPVPRLSLGDGLAQVPSSAPSACGDPADPAALIPASSSCTVDVRLAPDPRNPVLAGPLARGTYAIVGSTDVQTLNWTVPTDVAYPLSDSLPTTVGDSSSVDQAVLFSVTSGSVTFHDGALTDASPGPGHTVTLTGGPTTINGIAVPACEGGSSFAAGDLCAEVVHLDIAGGADASVPSSDLPSVTLTVPADQTINGAPRSTTVAASVFRVRPDNDAADRAPALDTASLLAGVAGTTGGATSEAGIDSVFTPEFDNASVWYTWTVPPGYDRPVTLATGSAADTVKVAFLGSSGCIGQVALCLNYSTDGSRFYAGSGDVYLIRVAHAPGGAGPFTLTLTDTPPYDQVFTYSRYVTGFSSNTTYATALPFDTFHTGVQPGEPGGAVSHTSWFRAFASSTPLSGFVKLGTTLNDPRTGASVTNGAISPLKVRLYRSPITNGFPSGFADLTEVLPEVAPPANFSGPIDLSPYFTNPPPFTFDGVYAYDGSQFLYFVQVDDPTPTGHGAYLWAQGQYQGAVGTVTPPVFGPIADVPAGRATGPDGKVVTYPAVTATDQTGPVATTCTPASGSTFPVGTTTVQCTASNAGGPTKATFKVIVDPTDPTAPTIATVAASPTTSGAVVVSFTPGWDGGSPIDHFQVDVLDRLGGFRWGTTSVAPGSGLLTGVVTGVPLGTPGLVTRVTAVPANAAIISATSPFSDVPVLVPPGATGAVSGSSNGSTAATSTSTNGPVSTSASAQGGAGTVTTAQYPVGTPIPAATTPFAQTATNPFDVVVGRDSTFTSVLITSCPATTGGKIWWFDPVNGWAPVVERPAAPAAPIVGGTFVAGPPACLRFTADKTSSPNVGQLTGPVFALSSSPAAPPSTVSAAAATVAVGQSTTVDVTVLDASGNPVPSADVLLTPSDAAVPVTASAGLDGTASFTVSSASAGPVSYAVTANGIAIGTASVTYVAKPVVSGTADVGEVGIAYTSSFSAASSLSVTFGATGLPAGLSIDPSTGVVSGKPSAAGIAHATITATSSLGTGGLAVDIDVRTALAITTASLPTFTSGLAGSTTVAASGGDPATYHWSVSGLPSGFAIDPGSGVIAGGPTVAGSFPVTVGVSDGLGGTSSTGFTLSVVPGAPASAVLSAPTAVVLVGSPVTITVTVLDVAANLVPGANVTLSVAGSAVSTVATSGAGVATFHVTGAASPGAVTYSAAVGTVPPVTGSVTYGTAPTVAATGPSAAEVGKVVTIPVTVTGSPAPTISFGSTLPSWLTFDPIAGRLSGSPTSAGPVSFSVTAANVLGSMSVTVSFMVAATPPPPPPAGADLGVSIASTGLASGEDALYVIRVTNTGTAATSGPITLTDVLPVGLTARAHAAIGWRCVAAGQQVTCTLSSVLGAGRSSTLLLAVRVSARPGTRLTNAVSVSGGFTDPTPADNAASISSTVTRG